MPQPEPDRLPMVIRSDDDTRINLERARVLLVDDNPFSLSILASALHGFGVQTIHRCGSTEEAKRVARRWRRCAGVDIAGPSR